MCVLVRARGVRPTADFAPTLCMQLEIQDLDRIDVMLEHTLGMFQWVCALEGGAGYNMPSERSAYGVHSAA